MRDRESRDITQAPCTHIQLDNLVSRVISASFFTWKFPLFIDGASAMKRDLLRSYDSVPVLNFMRIRPARGELVGKRQRERERSETEGGKCMRRFTEFLEQCEIKTIFNWRLRDVPPLQASNFLMRLFVRASTVFYLTKKMLFLVNIPLLLCRPPRRIYEEVRLLKTLRCFH